MRILLTIILSLFLSACASQNDLGTGKTGKSFTVSGHSYNQVWDAALASVNQTTGDQALEIAKDLHIKEQNRAQGKILASTGLSLLSWGEVVGIFITPPRNAASHTIEIESRAKLQTNVFANNWEDELMTAIKHNLNKAK